MKTQKLNLKSIKNVMSRDEMRKIMAGSGSGPGGCAIYGQQCGGPSGDACCAALSCNTDFWGRSTCGTYWG